MIILRYTNGLSFGASATSNAGGFFEDLGVLQWDLLSMTDITYVGEKVSSLRFNWMRFRSGPSVSFMLKESVFTIRREQCKID